MSFLFCYSVLKFLLLLAFLDKIETLPRQKNRPLICVPLSEETISDKSLGQLYQENAVAGQSAVRKTDAASQSAEAKDVSLLLERALEARPETSASVSEPDEALKALAKRYGVTYNDTKRYQLLQGYAKAVDYGDISALVGFDHYEHVSAEIHTKLVGATTKNGVTIADFATHFIDRVIGQTADPHRGMRQGVKIEDVLDALLNPVEIEPGKLREDGDVRQTFIGKRAYVTISVRDRRLIQTNPSGGKNKHVEND